MTKIIINGKTKCSVCKSANVTTVKDNNKLTTQHKCNNCGREWSNI